MGTLISNVYVVTEGREYVDYLDHALAECHRLLAEGRLPDSDAVADFLDDAKRVLQHVRRDVAAAGSGDEAIQTRVEMSAEEYKRVMSMGDSVKNLLEILEMRKALELNRTDAVARVAAAISGGTFQA